MASRTLGGLILEARTLLQDKVQVDGSTRYSDQEMFENLNGALLEVRAKRPDLWLDIGLRVPVPVFDYVNDLATNFPLDSAVYPAVLYYVVGRTELREDTFATDGRAVTLMNKFVSQLMSVSA